jgi:xeroderma pigmentosum group C-complementing protein
MSEESDFQTTSTSGSSTVKDSTGNKRRAIEKTAPVTLKKQKQEIDDLLEVDEGTISMDRDNEEEQQKNQQEKQQTNGHDAEIKDEDSGLDDADDPEFNPDYYSSDDDQEWVEVPVPGTHIPFWPSLLEFITSRKIVFLIIPCCVLFTEILPHQETAAEDYDQEEEMSGPWQYNAVEIIFDRPPEEVKK